MARFSLYSDQALQKHSAEPTEQLVTRQVNSLIYDEPKIVKSSLFPEEEAHSAGQVGTFPRDGTEPSALRQELLAILGHPKGASHGAPGVVAPLGHGTTMPCETRLASDAAGRVIVRRINLTGHLGERA